MLPGISTWTVVRSRKVRMQLLWPDYLADVRGLSPAACATGLAVGLLLWLLGWWGHRFWIVLIATAGAGIFGLYSGSASVTLAVLTGLLLAVAAGALALDLVRVAAFVAGGIAASMVVRVLVPSWTGWDELVLFFLAGGLAGLLLFRVWTMAVTSFVGTLVMGYFGLGLADRLGKLNAVALAEQRTVLLNWACAAVALLGLVIQFLLDRRLRAAREFWPHGRPGGDYVEHLHARRGWWRWGRGHYRRVL